MRTRFDTFGWRDYRPAPFRRARLITMDRESRRCSGLDRPTGKVGIVVGNSPSILVVDGLSETTEVLRAVFEPRGHAVNRVRQSQLPSGASLQPQLVIWHANESDDPVADRLAGVPRIVIGRASCPASVGETRRIAHPFEYGELLQAIETLLSAAG